MSPHTCDIATNAMQSHQLLNSVDPAVAKERWESLYSSYWPDLWELLTLDLTQLCKNTKAGECA